MEALTPERARQILAAISGDRYEAGYALAFAGLRESEILGLARSDLDLGRGIVTIRQPLSGSGVRATLVETKTAASVATIPMPLVVVERLRDHLARLDAERPIVPLGDSLVVDTEEGLAVDGSWFEELISGRPPCARRPHVPSASRRPGR